MAFAGPQALDSTHRFDSFDCGNRELNTWLKKHARQAHASGSAKTFVVTEAGQVVGYFSLTVGQVEAMTVPDGIRKGMARFPIPVVILARLAVSLHVQGRGVGRGLLQDAIRRTLVLAEQAGIRALLTHPVDDNASRFYLRFGFIPSPIREQQLLLLLKDARRCIASTSGGASSSSDLIGS